MDKERALEVLDQIPTIGEQVDALEMAIEALEKSRPQGKWIDYSDDGYVECPICRNATNCDGNIDELHFCWSCGAELTAEGGEK